MRFLFRANQSIRLRISTLLVLNSGMALLLASIALFAYENHQQRSAAARELSSQAGILAESSTAALTFNDEQAATQTLATLHSDSRVINAVIYDKNDRGFAVYSQGRAGKLSSLAAPPPDGAQFEQGALLVVQPIRVRGERVGTILIRSSNQVYSRLVRYTGIVCVVAAVSLCLAWLLSFRFQRSIADPITQLSNVARHISVDKDYAVRATGGSGGEIGVLIDSFNHMLSQIEARETARKAAVESLRDSEERYALAARGANDGLWDWKLTTNEIFLSPRWNQMLGGSGGVPWCNPDEWFGRVHPSDRERVMGALSDIREGCKDEFSCEYRILHRNGSFIWVLTRGTVVRDLAGIAVRMAGSQTDITEGKVADPLTGLPNRLYLLDKLESALDRSSQSAGQCAVLFLDLDKFKLVNDSLGHAAGDDLLVGVAERLKSAVRSSARESGSSSVVARLGGDEFAVLLDPVRDEGEVIEIAERILDKLKAPFALNERQMFASASVGVAFGNTEISPEDLLRNADTAMYYAKTTGRSRYAVFDEEMRERAVARLEVETDLRKAIISNELVLFYQPQVSLLTRQVTGYEALVRWNHPARGLLNPDRFIPIAEESDLIVQLGEWVLKEACRQMAEWHAKFHFRQPVTISVNVSPKQLVDQQLVPLVKAVLEESGLEAKYLKLEMTESSIMENRDHALSTLRELKALNVGLEIDDFGTGYSSLSNLHLLPFDTVKIDRSFINEMHAAEGSEIVRTILDLARSLEMQVVAEGVETQAQLQVLTGLGCDCVQGYYFSKPKSPEQTEMALLQDQMSRDLSSLQYANERSQPVPAPAEEEILVVGAH